MTVAAGACWPTPDQLLLLRAALWQGQPALAAWAEWTEGHDIDTVDVGSHRLLPLVYTNLRALGVEHPLLGRLKGLHRRTWYENRLLFHHMIPLVQAFEAAGIQTLILKGPALASLTYPDLGARPMEDFDLLAPTAQAADALDLLATLGFRPSPRAVQAFKPGYLSVIHSYPFVDAEGWELDLHWHVLAEGCQPDADADFWAGAVPFDLDGVATRTLNAADHLLHICVHGARWNETPPVRWVADAVRLLNAAGDLDWPRLTCQAERRRLVVPVREALRYLREALAAPIPSSVIERLFALPVTDDERREYELLTRPLATIGPASRLWLHYRRYLRTDHDIPLRHQPVGFARFLQHTWGLDHAWQLPGYALRGGVRRAWRAARAEGGASWT